MSDLISRSNLIRRIESEYREYGEDYDAEQILGDIEDMQTAYDIDKVVEELEMEMKASSGYSAERVSAFSRAIEIVKQGGVSDDDLEYYQNGIDEAIEIVKQGCVE